MDRFAGSGSATRASRSLLALVAFVPLALARADEPPEAERFLSVVACSKVSADEGRIEARAGSKTIELVGAAGVQWIEHASRRIGDLPDETPVHVLARKQGSQRTPEGSTISPRIISVGAVVAGEFTPPALTESQKESKLEWISGKLGRIQGKDLVLGGTLLGAGADRICIALVPRTWDAVTIAEGKSRPLLDKGSQIRVSGRLVPPESAAEGEAPKKALPRIALESAEILSKTFPAKEYAMILGTAR